MLSNRRVRKKLLLCAAGIVATTSVVSVAQAQSVWIGSLLGNFSNAANWSGGIIPQSSPLTSLLFIGGGTNATTATNDIAALFQVNSLAFASRATSPFTLASSGGGVIELAGTDATIAQNGLGDVQITSALSLAANTTVVGTGSGNIDLAGIVSGSGILSIGGTAPSLNTQQIRLSGVNTFTGGINLQSGNLVVKNAAALGTGTLRVSGGTLSFETSTTIVNTIALDGILTLVGGASPVFSSTAIASGIGGIRVLGSGSLRIESASTYTGATTLSFNNDVQRFAGGAPTLTLAGANGSILNSSVYNIGAGGTIRLDNTTATNTNRLGDATQINLASGTLELLGENGVTEVNERVGAVSGSGQNNIRVTPYTENTGNVALTIASLARSNRGTFAFFGTNNINSFFGQPPGATGGNNIYVTSDLTGDLIGTNAGVFSTAILPYAVTETGNSFGTGLATFAANSILPVASYFTNINSGFTDRNVRLTLSTTDVTAPRTLNSLVLGSSTSGSTALTTAGGTGSLTIGSGMLLLNNAATISVPLLFANREANLWVNSDSSISSSLSGTNGLTKSGYGTLTLSANNSGMTGALTINAGRIAFGAANNLPGVGPIRITGGTPSGLSVPTGLTYTGTGSVTLARDLVLGGEGATLSATQQGAVLTVSGNITGDAGLILNNPIPGFNLSSATTVLTGTNTFTGPLQLQSGDLVFSSDANLGTGALSLAGSSQGTQGLRLAGDWNTNRPIYFAGGILINTNAFNATLNGVLTGTSVTVVKRGSGTLMLTAESPFAASLFASEGVLSLAGNGALRTGSYTANTGGTLLLDNAAILQNDRVRDAAVISLNQGNFSVRGNAGGSVLENIGQLTVTGTGQSVVTLMKQGTPSVAVTSVGLSRQSNSPLLFRGDNLGIDTRFFFSSQSTGFLGGTVSADISPTGTGMGAGSGFAYYDQASGVRVAQDSDFVVVGAGQLFTAVQNSAPVSLSTGAFVRTIGIVSTGSAGQNNTVYGARIGAGSSLEIASGTTLTTTGGAVAFDGAGSVTGGTLTAGSNPLVVRASGTGAMIASNIGGLGGLQVTGGGAVSLTGTGSTITGGINIQNAALFVESSLSSSGAVVVGANGQLGGSGAVGATTTQAGAIIGPGSSIGALTVSSFLAAPGTFFDIDLGFGGASDQLRSNTFFNFSGAGIYTVRFFDGTTGNSLTASDVTGQQYRIARFSLNNTNYSSVNPSFVAQGGEGDLQTTGTFTLINPGDGFSYLTYSATTFQPVPAPPASVTLPFGAGMISVGAWWKRCGASRKRRV